MNSKLRVPLEILRCTASPEARLQLSRQHYALRGPCPTTLAEEGVLVLGDGVEFHLFEGSPAPETAAADSLHPVYLDASGAAYIPTGRVFIRLAEGQDARNAAEALRRAGFEIDSLRRRAPHAAWLVSASGSLAQALEDLPRLAEIDGLENAELQLLAPAARR